MSDEPPPAERPVWDEPPSRHSPTVRLFGGLLMAVGGLIGALSGTCSAFGLMVIGSTALNIHNGGWAELGQLVFMLLIFGGIPIAIGAGLFIWGRRLRR